jgi:hypothetical protein
MLREKKPFTDEVDTNVNLTEEDVNEHFEKYQFKVVWQKKTSSMLAIFSRWKAGQVSLACCVYLYSQ